MGMKICRNSKARKIYNGQMIYNISMKNLIRKMKSHKINDRPRIIYFLLKKHHRRILSREGTSITVAEIIGHGNNYYLYKGLVYISKKRKFIWLLVPKAASSSLRKLIAIIDDLDAVKNTPISQRKCLLRLYNGQAFPYSAHLSASSMKSLPEYQSYYKFCFVRNPWARLHSLYKQKIESPWVGDDNYYGVLRHRYGVKMDNSTTFEDFIKFIGKLPNFFSESHFVPYHNLFRPTEMDFIGRQENFEADIHHLISVIAPECKNIEIPQQNVSNQSISNHTIYRDYYSKRMKNIVARKYAKDIDFFNYKF